MLVDWLVAGLGAMLLLLLLWAAVSTLCEEDAWRDRERRKRR